MTIPMEMRAIVCFTEFQCRPLSNSECYSYWKKLTLLDHRHVVLHHAIAPLANIFRRAKVCKELKVMNQM